MMTKAAAKASLAEGLSKALYGTRPVNHSIRNGFIGALLTDEPLAGLAVGALTNQRHRAAMAAYRQRRSLVNTAGVAGMGAAGLGAYAASKRRK